jgi:hypothetical protein
MSCQSANELRLMLKWLKKARQLWEKVGGHPGDIADTYAYTAEYWKPIDPNKYVFYRKKAEEILKNDNTLTKRRKAFHYLFFADCAAMFHDDEWEEHLYEVGILFCSKDPSLEDFKIFFAQCLNDLIAFGQRGPQGEFGRVAAPQDCEETITSAAFKSWSFGPDAGN